MKNIYKSYKFSITPNDTQKKLLNKHFGACRFVYNYFLDITQKAYTEKQETRNYYDNIKDLVALKKTEEFSWLKEINSQSLQSSIQNIDAAYHRFFKNKSKYPKFKQKNSRQSFKVPQSVSIRGNKLRIPKFKQGIIINLHRQIEGDVLFATISKSTTGKYYASITCEVKYRPFEKTDKSVGVDVGIKELAILSDGTIYKNIRSLKNKLKKLKYNQRQLSKKNKGSNSRLKQKKNLARLYEKVTNIRKDYLHKVSTEIIKNHDVICIEDLAVKNIMKNHCLAQAMSDVSLGAFYEMLRYKSGWNDRSLVKIGRFFPSSKTCSSCGWIKQDLELKHRGWSCESCGEYHERDINAAKNILKQGINILSGCGIQSDIKQKRVEALPLGKSMKPEVYK